MGTRLTAEQYTKKWESLTATPTSWSPGSIGDPYKEGYDRIRWDKKPPDLDRNLKRSDSNEKRRNSSLCEMWGEG